MLTLDDLLFCYALVIAFGLAVIIVVCLSLYYDRKENQEP